MNTASQYEWVIGLYVYPSASAWTLNTSLIKFRTAVSNLLERFGLALTHVAANDGGFNGRITKAKSIYGKRVMESDLQGVRSLSLLVRQENSKMPSYGQIFYATLGLDYQKELSLCLAVNEGISNFLSDRFHAALGSFTELESWAFGLAFRDLVERSPEYHVLSLSPGCLSESESDSLMKWYESTPQDRLSRLRNVYPITIMSEKHLQYPVGKKTLREYISNVPGTEVSKLGALTIWKVPEDRLDMLRADLQSKGALIA